MLSRRSPRSRLPGARDHGACLRASPGRHHAAQPPPRRGWRADFSDPLSPPCRSSRIPHPKHTVSSEVIAPSPEMLSSLIFTPSTIEALLGHESDSMAGAAGERASTARSGSPGPCRRRGAIRRSRDVSVIGVLSSPRNPIRSITTDMVSCPATVAAVTPPDAQRAHGEQHRCHVGRAPAGRRSGSTT